MLLMQVSLLFLYSFNVNACLALPPQQAQPGNFTPAKVARPER